MIFLQTVFALMLLSWPIMLMLLLHYKWAAKFHEDCHLYWHKNSEKYFKLWSEKPITEEDPADWWKRGKQ